MKSVDQYCKLREGLKWSSEDTEFIVQQVRLLQAAFIKIGSLRYEDGRRDGAQERGLLPVTKEEVDDILKGSRTKRF